MKVYGLVGHPLSHSFSQKYFNDKFEKLAIKDSRYDLFDLQSIEEVEDLKSSQPDLVGFNVTIPYKEAIIPHLDDLDESAEIVGAVNVVKRMDDNQWKGYNSDYFGFEKSLEDWLPQQGIKSLVLGTGGASKAVVAVLKHLNIEYKTVSRNEGKADYTYISLKADHQMVKQYKLIINTTPLGMHPNIDISPDIDYSSLSPQHYLYDLVYNPKQTLFMSKGKEQGSQTKNGLEMLELQAEKSWEIWNAIH